MSVEKNVTNNGLLVDNELDIHGLCRSLWCGKLWIMGMVILFALIALAVSYLMKPRWIAVAITDKPTVNSLAGYYSQQQLLRNLDMHISGSTPSNERPSIPDEAYNEFTTQLAAYDTRRDFWRQSDYYKQRQQDDTQTDARLLDELVNDISVSVRDNKKMLNDSVKLIAETAAEANTLLRQYVNFANKRATSHLNDEIQGAWAARTQAIKAQIKQQEAVTHAVYTRELNRVQQALKIASQQKINRNQTDVSTEQLPNSELFLLGRPILQARLEMLEASGENFGPDYDQNRALLATLNVKPTLDAKFQTYRYLQTPEEPVTRSSPRRAFLMIMWGAIGGLIGAGIVLSRRISMLQASSVVY
ncbi:ECA polysaccharide chain length modulation protein [Candidatus Fukatsuia symbiotica]|uniref:ECA polysaccharide chain length modulation protein n=2 Tax=Candidatus Fukatsuia symbiotica TaxID=1878942 RepID=A0A2U8I8J0_9GAMM|nr:ECA polysaccharide chain length modulation protein [Candidatus Fukatsuia symbiotica]AWK15437.1 polysaccharide chain length modulation protein [Candidatus Fukatsuia symbiotica]MEA9443791.1 ECA polysaccharide chain length modulation protein [Candidatus Fukatsuia symbiotica]